MSSMDMFAQSILQRDRYRMVRLQVYNWGTFSGIHDIPISEKGFLFVGPSGAGKSTLLDAFTSLLIPPKWVDFNAAAREAARSGKDRNLVTYVRGAWGEQKDDETGSIITRYLRPETTWSGLALTYRSDSGHTVVIAEIFWIKGKSNVTADVKRRYLVLERPFDLWEVKDFDLDDRKLKRSLSEAFIKEDFSPYCERFRGLLGIDTEAALRLLHKTQSAKNLGDLNDFLRDFMLEKPESFKSADQLVSEFGELSEAHKSVVTAREQIYVLAPASKAYDTWTALETTSSKLSGLRNGADAYFKHKTLELTEGEIEILSGKIERLRGEEEAKLDGLNAVKSRISTLQASYRDAGGDVIERLTHDKARYEHERDVRSRRASQLEETCLHLGWEVPVDAESFAVVLQSAKEMATTWETSLERLEEEKVSTRMKLAKETEQFEGTSEEIRSLQSRPSNIPAEWLDFRENVALKLGIPEASLPFVGELLEVKESEIEWQGAIERLLRGFALSLLVEDKNYAALSNFLNSSHLGRRVVYYRVGDVQDTKQRPLGPVSLVHKLKIKDSKFNVWLKNELYQRFDYACSDSFREFQNQDYALTREGLVKRGNSRHEKDDQHAVNDKRRWVLGFNNQEKLKIYIAQAQQLASEMAKLQSLLDKLNSTGKEGHQQAMLSRSIMNLQWQEVDIASMIKEIAALEQSIKAAQSTKNGLRKIEERISEETKKLENLEVAYRELRIKLDKLRDRREDLSRKRVQLREDCSQLVVPKEVRLELESRIVVKDSALSLENMAERVRQLVMTLSREIEATMKERDKHEREVEKRFAEFKRSWPNEAADMDATIHSAHDYFVKLMRLETDNLPAYEERFFELLRNQSHQNLAALSSHLQQGRKEISDKLELVNEGLNQAPFNPGTFLHIIATDRQLPEVREFKQEIQQVLGNAWTQDRETAEARFKVLKNLVSRLNGQEPHERRWRDLVLDVRLHVEFMAREAREDGTEVEIYRSGSGKSGGQRQKLATTCLAAALRYQLGGFDSGSPSYSPVILDEAFDKADPDFTTLAMNIFKNFGFQMIVATPLKSVMTLEPFIGGACVVGIRDRKHSGIILVEYDNVDSRLKLPVVAVDKVEA